MACGDPVMRRLVFLAMGVLEGSVAAVLVVFGCQIPAKSDVEQGFGRVQQVTQRAAGQVQQLRGQLGELRRPELQSLARQLRDETRAVTALLREQQVDFKSIATLRDALGVVASGLQGLARTLDPEGARRLAQG